MGLKLNFYVSMMLQDRITENIMDLTFLEAAQRSSGSLSEAIKQTASVSTLFNNINKAVLSVILLVAYVFLMLLVSPSLTLLSAALLFLAGFGLTGLIKKMKHMGGEISLASRGTEQAIFEYLHIPRFVRIFNLQEYSKGDIKQRRDLLLDRSRRTSQIRALIHPIIENFTVVSAGLLLVIGFWLSTSDPEIGLASVFLFLLALYRAMPQVTNLNNIRATWATYIHRLQFVSEFWTIPSTLKESRDGTPIERFNEGIEFRNVSLRYPGTNAEQLKDVSFDIPRGRTIAIVGPSGAGKTTLGFLLLKLMNPTEGAILIDGTKLSKIQNYSWRSLVGYVEQDVTLLNRTVLENITIGLSEFEMDDVIRATKLANAYEFVVALPEGFDTRVGERGYMLSGGQKQRLALARAIIRSPQLLILDEATSSLDVKSEQLIQDAIRTLQNEFTMLIIAHRFSTIVNADELVVLNDGMVVQRGTLQELIAKPGLFSTLWEKQFQGCFDDERPVETGDSVN